QDSLLLELVQNVSVHYGSIRARLLLPELRHEELYVRVPSAPEVLDALAQAETGEDLIASVCKRDIDSVDDDSAKLILLRRDRLVAAARGYCWLVGMVKELLLAELDELGEHAVLRHGRLLTCELVEHVAELRLGIAELQCELEQGRIVRDEIGLFH